MRIHPLFKWFGSKWQSAKHYPPPLRDCPIFEPFAGSAGYALNHCDLAVGIWEDDPQVRALWRWLIEDATRGEILDIPVGLAIGSDIRAANLSRGQQLLLKHWQRTNNVGDCWTVSPWGHLPGQWTAGTRWRVAHEVSAIKHWRLIEPAYMLEAGAATWFIDPPYQYNYHYSRALPAFDFAELARDVREIDARCRVIVCEAVCPKTSRKPDYLPFVASHRSVTSRRKQTQSHHSRELVYIREPV